MPPALGRQRVGPWVSPGKKKPGAWPGYRHQLIGSAVRLQGISGPAIDSSGSLVFRVHAFPAQHFQGVGALVRHLILPSAFLQAIKNLAEARFQGLEWCHPISSRAFGPAPWRGKEPQGNAPVINSYLCLP